MGRLELGPVQTGVQAVLFQQFGVRADLDDAAALQHHQAVRPVRSVLSRWAMAIVVRPCTRLSKASWISRSVSVSTADVASSRIRIRGSISSARAIEIRCRSPPESDLAALAHQRVVAQRQAQDEFVGPGGLGGGDDFVARSVGPAVGDVFGDRAVEQERLLQHDADVAAIIVDGNERMSMPSTRIAPSATS